MFVLKAVESGKEYPLDAARVAVGRDPSNDLVLEDPSISGFHAILFLEDGTLSITDLGSSNGSRVDAVPAQGRVAVPAWSTLELGNVRLEVRDPNRRAPTRVMPAVGASTEKGLITVGANEAGPDDDSSRPRLVLRSEGPYPATILVRGELTVGRAPDAGLRLGVDTVSARHATITIKAGAVEILDEGSTNGTWINGKRVSHRQLRHGDRVRFDTIEYELVDHAGGSVSATRVNPAVEAMEGPTSLGPAVGGLGEPTRIEPVVSDDRAEAYDPAPTLLGSAAYTPQEPVRSIDDTAFKGFPSRDAERPFPSGAASPLGYAGAMRGAAQPSDDRLSTLFQLMFSEYASFVAGVVLLVTAAAVVLAFQIIVMGGFDRLADPMQAMHAAQMMRGREAEWAVILSLHGLLSIGALFLLLRGAASVLKVPSVDPRNAWMRSLAYVGVWLLAAIALVLMAIASGLLGALLAMVAGGQVGIAFAIILSLGGLVYLFLRLWPMFVQVALYQSSGAIFDAWDATGRPGALAKASWPMLGWMLLGFLPLVALTALGMAGETGYLVSIVGTLAWMALVVPLLVLVGVSRWQRIAPAKGH